MINQLYVYLESTAKYIALPLGLYITWLIIKRVSRNSAKQAIDKDRKEAELINTTLDDIERDLWNAQKEERNRKM